LTGQQGDVAAAAAFHEPEPKIQSGYVPFGPKYETYLNLFMSIKIF
jgi:hypothetical protein